MTVSTWTIYERPRDYPTGFVARRFEGEAPTGDALYADNLDALRDVLQGMGLVMLMRQPDDPVVIVETWL